jgi:hypothetical protein
MKILSLPTHLQDCLSDPTSFFYFSVYFMIPNVFFFGRQMSSIFPASAHNLAPGRPFHLAGAPFPDGYSLCVVERRSRLDSRDLIYCYFNHRNQNSIATASHIRTTGKRDPAARTALLDICNTQFLLRSLFLKVLIFAKIGGPIFSALQK